MNDKAHNKDVTQDENVTRDTDHEPRIDTRGPVHPRYQEDCQNFEDTLVDIIRLAGESAALIKDGEAEEARKQWKETTRKYAEAGRTARTMFNKMAALEDKLKAAEEGGSTDRGPRTVPVEELARLVEKWM